MSSRSGGCAECTRLGDPALVLCGAIFLEGIDGAMLNVALLSIRADPVCPPAPCNGSVSAYVLGYGGFMLVGRTPPTSSGAAGCSSLWLSVFLLFSGLGGFATEGWTLIVARFVTGVAAAFMTPAGLSLITTSFDEGPQRTKALLSGYSAPRPAASRSAWSSAGCSPRSAGAGRSSHRSCSPLILLAALALVPRTPRPDRTGQSVDLAGGLTRHRPPSSCFVLGVERAAHTQPRADFRTLGAGLAFPRRVPRRGAPRASPLVRLGIFRNVALVRANLVGLLFAGLLRPPVPGRPSTSRNCATGRPCRPASR
ncbi:hypothetical protein LT493_39710 [Streptomyces tricolor]|nr:hypothetical protein [Streptomyces tricolor]